MATNTQTLTETAAQMLAIKADRVETERTLSGFDIARAWFPETERVVKVAEYQKGHLTVTIHGQNGGETSRIVLSAPSYELLGSVLNAATWA